MTTKKKTIGISVFLGFLFFCNPNISIIDFFPDFIGYICLCIGLSRLANLNESISGAVSVFRKMIWIDAGKWLALLWIFGLSDPNEQSSLILLGSFVFAVAEMICLILAYHRLFDGINQLGYFYPNTSIFLDKSGRKKNATDRMRNLTVVFVSMKAMLSFLPELADLTNNVYDEGSEWMNLYRYIGVIRMMAFLPVLIFGFIWVIRMERYLYRIRKDHLLMEALQERYNQNVLPKTGMFVRRHFRTVQVVFLIALCFLVDFRLEQRNMIPDFLVALFLFVTLFLLSKYFQTPKPIWIPLCIAFVLSTVATFLAENRFFDKYTYSAIIRSDEARTVYTVLIVTTILQSLLLIVLLWMIVQALCQIIRSHTGSVVGKERQGIMEEKMTEEMQKELRRSTYFGFFAAVLYAAVDVLCLLIAPTVKFAGMIQLLFVLIAIVAIARAVSSIKQAVDTKYMLE